MSPAQKFFPAYFRPRNQYEIASGLCSVLIVLCALIGHMAFQLFPQGIFSAMIYTIPLGIIPGILAIVSRKLIQRSQTWLVSVGKEDQAR